MVWSGQTVEDTIALHQLAAHYAHVVDSGDYQLLREVFTEDIELDAAQFYEPLRIGIDLVIAAYASGRHPVAHHTTNVVVTTDPDGTVRMRSKVISLLGDGLCGSGTYDDVCVMTATGWRIQHRVVRLRRESDLANPPPRRAR